MNRSAKNFFINTLIAIAGINLFGEGLELIEHVLIGVGTILFVRGGFYLVNEGCKKLFGENK
jgi:hypothetical protein